VTRAAWRVAQVEGGGGGVGVSVSVLVLAVELALGSVLVSGARMPKMFHHGDHIAITLPFTRFWEMGPK